MRGKAYFAVGNGRRRRGARRCGMRLIVFLGLFFAVALVAGAKNLGNALFESDLQAEDLAILLCIRQFYYDETLVTDINIVEMSDILGVSYHTFYRRYDILKKKGYITIKVKNNTSLSKLEDKDFEWRVNIEKKLNDTYDMTKRNSEEIEMLKTLLYKTIKADKKGSKEEYFKSLKKQSD